MTMGQFRSRSAAAFLAAIFSAAIQDGAQAQTALDLPTIDVRGGAGSLTVPGTDSAREAIQRTPGAVSVVPDTAFRQSPAATIKDIVDYVPGVFAQPKWGDDTRLSIRGSGLSRNFHLRSTQLLMDGVIPINTADGYGDFQEIDPSFYRYVEVYKGSNALRFGANALGGAINFVMPTGYDAPRAQVRVDAGSFGTIRTQGAAAGVNGPFDYYLSGSVSRTDGYRDHSDGHAARFSGNIGYRFSPDVETRFYLNANTVRQRIPGEVDRTTALTTPERGWSANLVDDWQRNIDTVRLANKTTIRLDNTVIDLGVFATDRHLMHPIFQWLDYRYREYGAFARAVDDRLIGGFRNRLTVGVNVHNGENDARQYANVGGQKNGLLSALKQQSQNYSAYAENAFYVLPQLAIVTGLQYLHAVRDQEVVFSANGDVPGRSDFDLWSPKAGLLYEIDKDWQLFANVSRSQEAPSFGESVAPNFMNPALPTLRFFDIRAQRATTFEFGTRGRRGEDFTWDFAVYRSQIRNELQCFYSAFGNCNVTNADRTIHQGVEAAVGATLWKGIAVQAEKPDRLWLNVAYTYNDFRYDGDATFGNNELPGAPPHYVRAELLYKHPSGFSFGPNIEWVPQAYFVDSANTLKSDPYLLWGLKAAYENGKGFSAYVEGRNLSNQTYIASASIIDRATPTSRLFNPGTGRALYAGMRMEW